MRKNNGRKKAVRFAAFALATVVMATGIPMSVLADNESSEEITLTDENETSDVNEAVNEENEAPGSETAETESAAEEASDSLIPVDNLIDENNNPLNVEDYSQKTEEIKEDLNNASALVSNVSSDVQGDEGYVQKLEQEIDNALDAGQNIDTILEGVSKADDQIIVDVPVYNDDGTPAYESDKAGKPIQKTVKADMNEKIKDIQGDFYTDKKTGTSAGLDAASASQQKSAEANDPTKSVDERKEAQTEAQDQLDIAEGILAEANKKVDTAQATRDAAKKKLDDAKAVRDGALKSAEEAEEQNLKGAIKDSAAALKAVNAAKTKTETLQKEVDELYKDLNNIDLLEQIQAKDAEVKKIAGSNPDFMNSSDYREKTEQLCKLIIEYNILNQEGIIVEMGADFEITLLQHDIDLDKATLDTATNMYELAGKNVTFTHEDEKFDSSDPAYKDAQGWIHANNNNDNRVVVKFKDKDGNEYTRYYNYKANDDGSIYIYERSYTIETEDTYEVAAQEATQAEVIPAHWENGYGEKPAEGMEVAKIEVLGVSYDELPVLNFGVAYDPAAPVESREEFQNEDGSVKYRPLEGSEIVTNTYDIYTGELTIKTECIRKEYNYKTTPNCSEYGYWYSSDDEIRAYAEYVIENYSLYSWLKEIRDDPDVIDFTIIIENTTPNSDHRGFRVEYYKYDKNSDDIHLYSEYKYSETKIYDTYVEEQTIEAKPAKPGIRAYTDETGITWKTDDESIVAAVNKYIKDIQTDENGHVLSAKNTDEYSYLKLMEKLEKYQSQKKALADANEKLANAQEKFEALNAQAKKLKMYVYDTSNLEYLEEQLEKAEAALAEALVARDSLKREVTKAREAVAAIVIPEPSEEEKASVQEESSKAKGHSDDDESSEDTSGGEYYSYFDMTSGIPVFVPTSGGDALGVADVRSTNTRGRRIKGNASARDAVVIGDETGDTTDDVNGNEAANGDYESADVSGDADMTYTSIEKEEVPLNATPTQTGSNMPVALALLATVGGAGIAGVSVFKFRGKKR